MLPLVLHSFVRNVRASFNYGFATWIDFDVCAISQLDSRFAVSYLHSLCLIWRPWRLSWSTVFVVDRVRSLCARLHRLPRPLAKLMKNWSRELGWPVTFVSRENQETDEEVITSAGRKKRE